MNLGIPLRTLLLTVFWSLAATAFAREPDLAVLPLANHTNLAAAQADLEPVLVQALAEKGWTVSASAELRPFLREYRIRSRGWIGRADAQRLSERTGARFLLLGSWDVFREGENSEVGFSLRLLDTRSMTLVRAVSCGTTAEDQVGLLGLGKVTSCRELAVILLDRALSGWTPADLAEGPQAGGLTLVPIPLDNFTADDYAGAILDAVLVSGLMERGYHVVEPGFVREIAIARETYPVGGVNRETALVLQETLGADFLVTGTVDLFAPAAGDPHVSAPRVACGLRIIDPARSIVLLAREIERAGDDHDGLLQTRRIHGLIPLAAKTLDIFIENLEHLNTEHLESEELITDE